MKTLALAAGVTIILSIAGLNPVAAVTSNNAEVTKETNISVNAKNFNINTNIQKQIFTTETSTIIKNAEMIALMAGEKPASSDTLWKASSESGYAGSSKPGNWGSKKSKSIGKNGSITVVKKNLYKLEKISKTGLGETTCSVLVKPTVNKIQTRNLNCKPS